MSFLSGLVMQASPWVLATGSRNQLLRVQVFTGEPQAREFPTPSSYSKTQATHTQRSQSMTHSCCWCKHTHTLTVDFPDTLTVNMMDIFSLACLHYCLHACYTKLPLNSSFTCIYTYKSCPNAVQRCAAWPCPQTCMVCRECLALAGR
jgi:hypothetical protein